jgi:5-methyltetrahydrofolate--homocysteine methyltransferase
MVNLEELSQAIISGDADVSFELTKQALEARMSAANILGQGLIPGLRRVGDLFESGEYFLPELIVSGDAAARALELLEPVLGQKGSPYMGRFLIGTVKGDIHDLGKNIVTMMLKGNGWDVTDLGVDVAPEEFCSAAAQGGYDIVGLSSLLTMTMPKVAETIAALEAAGLRAKTKIMVGGAPTTPEWAEEIGADAHAKDGPTAASVAAKLVGK